MGDVYAIREDTGDRVLIAIGCDGDGCSAVLKPGPHVVGSGWVQVGTAYVCDVAGGGFTSFGRSDGYRNYYCPGCAPEDV